MDPERPSSPSENLAALRIDKERTGFRKTRRARTVWVLLCLLLVVAGALLVQTGVLLPAMDVQVGRVQKLHPFQVHTLLNASGYVAAQRKAAVASKLTGRLIHLGVEEGSPVREGEAIARLENKDALAARDRARANVEWAGFQLKRAQVELGNARLDYGRKQRLVEGGHLARSEFDASEARFKSAQAEVEAQKAALRAAEAALVEAEVLLEYTVIRAPFDAVVLTKNADIGDIVTPLGAAADAKSAVVTIADMMSLQVEADVSESNIGLVTLGQPCVIQLDALPEERFPGHVHMVVPTADRAKASVLVKVAFRELDPRILPEMSAKVAFLSRSMDGESEAPFTAVSSSAVVRREQETVVFRVRRDRVFRTPVRTGLNWGDLTEVIQGVEPGDLVLLAPSDRLKDGGKVRFPQM